MSDLPLPQPGTGDEIKVGNIENSNIVAIGAGATAVYNEGLSTEAVAALVVELKRIDQPKVWNGRFPYLGLTAFQESDAQLFFGRESLVDDLLERIQTARFIVIAGPSGSGKSSVARAGLFHALREGRLEKSDGWLLATMQPKGDPIEQLAIAMARLAKSPNAGNHLRENGKENSLALHEQIEALSGDDNRQRCILLVDQFEETFTQTKEEDRAAFINLLTTAAQAENGRTTILLSLRSDFISHCARYPDLRSLMSQQFQLVGAMDPPDLAKAITLPALEVGVEISPELVSRIIVDMKGEPGALPLMSFALRDLFEAEKTAKGEPMDLTLAEYLGRGGIEEALERHANKVFEDFSDEQKVLARGVFSKLIEVGYGRADTRRTAAINELIPAGTEAEAVIAVVNALAKESVRLITTGGDEIGEGSASGGTVTIAHEKLIDAWPWLRQLVDENRDMIILQNQINDDAQAWAKEDDAGYLYRGGRLVQVEEKLSVLQPNLNTLSQRFVQASFAERDAAQQAEAERIQKEEALKQERANAGRFRRLTRWLSVAAAVAVIATIVALFFLNTARQESVAAASARAAAEIGATTESQARHEAVIARGTSDANAQLASTREGEAIIAYATSEFNAELAATNEAEAVTAQRTAQADAIRAFNAEATAVAAQLKSDTNAEQAINLAQVRLADSDYLENVIATADDALATQEAFFSSDAVYQTQFDNTQQVRNALNTVFAQNLQTGLNINPDVDNLNEDVLDGLDWVRFVIKLDLASENPGEIESAVTRYEPVVEGYALKGISILFVINQETFWGNSPWENPTEESWSAYADEMAQNANLLAQAMSRRYAKYGALIAYEIWNEPDLQYSPSSVYIPPEVYAIILNRTASAIRAASPEAKIVFGSLASGPQNGVSYIQTVRDELGGDLPIDAIGLEPYGRWGTFAPFDWGGSYGTLEEAFGIYHEAFPNIPLWVTEIGIASDYPIGPEYYSEWSTYLVDVYQYIGLNYARQVPVVIWFAWSDLTQNAGIVDAYGKPKAPIYDAFADVRSGAIFEDQTE